MIFVVDGNNLFYRFCSYLAGKNEKFLERENDDRVLMNAVYSNITNTMKNLSIVPETVFFTADGSWNWRAKLDYPDVQYKEGRSYSELFNHDKLKAIMKVFGNLMAKNNGWCFSQIDGYEGDDMLSIISNHYYEQGKSSLILSSDGDARQLVKWNGKNYISVFDTQSDKMNHYVHQDFGGDNDDEFGGIFNMDTDDTTSHILNSAHVRVDPIKLAFIKIIGGDSGDKVPSVYVKKIAKDKTTSFGNGYAKSLFEKKQYGNEIINRLFTDEPTRRMVASDVINHMKSHELNKITSIADNIIRNMKYVWLDTSIYTNEQKNEVMEHVNKHVSTDATMNDLKFD